MKLDYYFLAQVFVNLMQADGYYSLFIVLQKHNSHPKSDLKVR